MVLEPIDPLRISTVVNVPPARAWEVFTEQMGTWWPLATHSLFADEGSAADGVVVEGRVGGEIYERLGELRRHWATILVWDPPARITWEWGINPDNPTTEVTVDFKPHGEGTLVEVVHSGWEAYAERAEEMRASYSADEGWGSVIQAYEHFLNG